MTVIVDESPAFTDEGLKPTVVPAGTPLALSAMLCADPFVTAVPIVDVALLPCCTLRLFGLDAIEKSSAGGGVTVRGTSTVCVALEPVPVTVTV